MWWPFRRRRATAAPAVSTPLPGPAGRGWRLVTPLRLTVAARAPILAPLFAPPVVAGTRRLVRELPVLLHRMPRRTEQPVPSAIPAGQVTGLVAVRPTIADEPTPAVRSDRSDRQAVDAVDADPPAEPVEPEPLVRHRLGRPPVSAWHAQLTEATPEYVGEPVEPAVPFRGVTELDRIAAQYEQLGVAEALAALAAEFPGPVEPPPLASPQPVHLPPRERPNLAQSRRMGIGAIPTEPEAEPAVEPDERTPEPDEPVGLSLAEPLVRRHQPDERLAESPADPVMVPAETVPSLGPEPIDDPAPAPSAAPPLPPRGPVATDPVGSDVPTPRRDPVVPLVVTRTVEPPLWPRPAADNRRAARARRDPDDEPPDDQPAPQPDLVHRTQSIVDFAVPEPAADDHDDPSPPEHRHDDEHDHRHDDEHDQRHDDDGHDEPRDRSPDRTHDEPAQPTGPVYRAVLDDRAPVPLPADTAPDTMVVTVPAELVTAFRHDLGVDVSVVPVNRGRAVSRQAARLGARAYATGGQVYLPDEVGDPSLPPARALLAHELTHAVQQRMLGTRTPAADSAAGRELEWEADSVERWVAGAGPTPPALLHHRPPGGAVDHSSPPGEVIQQAGPATAVATHVEPVPEPAAQPAAVSWSLDTGFHIGPTTEPATPTGFPVHPALAPTYQPDTGAAMARVFDEIAELRASVVDLSTREPEQPEPMEFGDLAGRIYQHIRARLRAELVIDRERAGLLADVG